VQQGLGQAAAPVAAQAGAPVAVPEREYSPVLMPVVPEREQEVAPDPLADLPVDNGLPPWRRLASLLQGL